MNAPPVIVAPGKSSTDLDANPLPVPPTKGSHVPNTPGQFPSREWSGVGSPNSSLQERPGISAPVLAFVGLLLLLAAARVAVQWNLPLPFCGLKRLTGIPCPFCGSTRCLQACSSFDFASAMRWNPLTFLSYLGIVLWFGVWTADRFFNRRWLATVQRWPVAPALRPFLVGAVVLNWIYLCLTLS